MQDLAHYRFSPGVVQQLKIIEQFQGKWIGLAQASLSQASIETLAQTTIITSAGASTRIEGALMSDEAISAFADNGAKITALSSRSEREVNGYIDTLRYIYDHVDVLDISEHTLRTLHQKLTAYLTETELPTSQRGAYKNVANDVIEKDNSTGQTKTWFHTTPPGPQTSAAMECLIRDFHQLWVDGRLSHIVLTAVFIVRFLAIHPFRDGNGRLSRLLTTWLLLKAGYSWQRYVSHEKFIEDNKLAYYVNLRKTQRTFRTSTFAADHVDYDPWLAFFFMIMTSQLRFLEQAIRVDTPQSVLSEREAAVYRLIQANGQSTISFIETELGFKRSGLKALLRRLVDRAIIRQVGKNKGAYYEVNTAKE